MEFKRYTFFIVGSTIAFFLVAICTSFIVDPIGIWGTQDIPGVNQNKVKQSSYLDVFKPYEASRLKPDIVWIGTSRVYVGFTMDKSSNEYNMGASSLSLTDIKKYLHFIYNENKPRKVYLGLDLLQFDKENLETPRVGFSDKRLDAINKGYITKTAMKIQDSMGIIKDVPVTIKNSRNDKEYYFLLGQDIKRGHSDEVDPDSYYSTIEQYTNTYKKFSYSPDAMKCLRDIVSEANDNDVELVLFINPASVDLQLLQHIYGRQEKFFNIKKEIASFHPVYDFCWINQYDTNRTKYYYDASHFRSPYGDLCRAAMLGIDNGTVIYLDSENIDKSLEKEKTIFNKWMNDNYDYYNALAKNSNRTDLKAGDLKEYIGF
jgi:hypothetical protein